MARIYKRHGGSCPLKDWDAHRCECTFYAEYLEPGADGFSRRRKSVRTADKREARRRARDLELAGPDQPRDEPVPLIDALGWVLRQTQTAGTKDCYTKKGRHLVRLLGRSRNLLELGRADVAEYIDTRQDEGAMNSTIKKEMVVLRLALSEASAREHQVPDPRKVIPKIKDDQRRGDRWLTRDEYRRLMAELEPDRQAFVRVHVWAGANYSEAMGLEPGDVGTDTIKIRGTKRRSRWRTIPLSAELEGIADHLPLRAWPNYNRDLAAACRRAGIEPVSSNDLRRTFGSWLVQAGFSLKTVAQLMGHSSTRMVDLHYGHLANENLVEAIAALTETDMDQQPAV